MPAAESGTRDGLILIIERAMAGNGALESAEIKAIDTFITGPVTTLGALHNDWVSKITSRTPVLNGGNFGEKIKGATAAITSEAEANL